MRTNEQRSLLTAGRMFDRKDITIDLSLYPKRLTRCRPAILSKPYRKVLSSFGKSLWSAVGMTFADQRLQMADDAGPSVRQGW